MRPLFLFKSEEKTDQGRPEKHFFWPKGTIFTKELKENDHSMVIFL